MTPGLGNRCSIQLSYGDGARTILRRRRRCHRPAYLAKRRCAIGGGLAVSGLKRWIELLTALAELPTY